MGTTTSRYIKKKKVSAEQRKRNQQAVEKAKKLNKNVKK